MPSALLREMLYIRAEDVSDRLYKKIVKEFSHTIEVYVPPSLCEQCYKRYYSEPPCQEGEDCPYKKKTLTMFKKTSLNGHKVIGLWRGDLFLLRKVLGKRFTLVDKRDIVAANYPITFTKELWRHQKEAIRDWSKGKYGGMIKAPARSGKTVIGTYLTARLGLKTLILCHQDDLLDQFLDTFKEFTDFKNAAKIAGKPIIQKARKGNIVDLVEQDVDVILSTYQTFITKMGKVRLKKIQNRFGLLMVDECHLTGANCYSKVVTHINSFLRLGLTATPDRKDTRDVLAKYAIGPVTASVAPKELVGKGHLIYTQQSVGRWSYWATMVGRLVNKKARNEIIVSYALKDIADGHKLIMITDRRVHAQILAEMLIKYKVRPQILYRGVNRKKILRLARLGKLPVIIATRKIARFGLNVPPWSAYYCLTPINNPPNFYQEFSRVRTPHEGKKEPIVVRVFVDNFKASYACGNTCARVLKEQGFTVKKESYDEGLLSKVQKRKGKKSKVWSKFDLLD
jgi:superfamily II DNA or RNA helicase